MLNGPQVVEVFHYFVHRYVMMVYVIVVVWWRPACLRLGSEQAIPSWC